MKPIMMILPFAAKCSAGGLYFFFISSVCCTFFFINPVYAGRANRVIHIFIDNSKTIPKEIEITNILRELLEPFADLIQFGFDENYDTIYIHTFSDKVREKTRFGRTDHTWFRSFLASCINDIGDKNNSARQDQTDLTALFKAINDTTGDIHSYHENHTDKYFYYFVVISDFFYSTDPNQTCDFGKDPERLKNALKNQVRSFIDTYEKDKNTDRLFYHFIRLKIPNKDETSEQDCIKFTNTIWNQLEDTKGVKTIVFDLENDFRHVDGRLKKSKMDQHKSYIKEYSEKILVPLTCSIKNQQSKYDDNNEELKLVLNFENPNFRGITIKKLKFEKESDQNKTQLTISKWINDKENLQEGNIKKKIPSERKTDIILFIKPQNMEGEWLLSYECDPKIEEARIRSLYINIPQAIPKFATNLAASQLKTSPLEISFDVENIPDSQTISYDMIDFRLTKNNWEVKGVVVQHSNPVKVRFDTSENVFDPAYKITIDAGRYYHKNTSEQSKQNASSATPLNSDITAKALFNIKSPEALGSSLNMHNGYCVIFIFLGHFIFIITLDLFCHELRQGPFLLSFIPPVLLGGFAVFDQIWPEKIGQDSLIFILFISLPCSFLILICSVFLKKRHLFWNEYMTADYNRVVSKKDLCFSKICLNTIIYLFLKVAPNLMSCIFVCPKRLTDKFFLWSCSCIVLTSILINLHLSNMKFSILTYFLMVLYLITLFRLFCISIFK